MLDEYVWMCEIHIQLCSICITLSDLQWGKYNCIVKEIKSIIKHLPPYSCIYNTIMYNCFHNEALINFKIGK